MLIKFDYYYIVFRNKLERNNQMKILLLLVFVSGLSVWVELLLETESLLEVFDPEVMPQLTAAPQT